MLNNNFKREYVTQELKQELAEIRVNQVTDYQYSNPSEYFKNVITTIEKHLPLGTGRVVNYVTKLELTQYILDGGLSEQGKEEPLKLVRNMLRDIDLNHVAWLTDEHHEELKNISTRNVDDLIKEILAFE